MMSIEQALMEIFRRGQHIDMAGQARNFSDADLKASAEAYDPDLHEAPHVIGHPAMNAPAYGWVRSLEYSEEDGLLRAGSRQVEPQFAEMVNEGRFKKRSASFYPPDHPKNPKPGVYYLKHVGWLGAAPPAVKGMKDAHFGAEDEDCVVVEFADSADHSDSFVPRAIASMVRRMRDYFIEKEGVDAADKIIPDYMTDSDFYEPIEPASSAYSEPGKPDTATPEDSTVELTAEQIAAKEAEFAERDRQLKEDEDRIAAEKARTRKAGITSFVEGLVKSGRILPKHQAGLVEFMDCFEAAVDEGTTIEFAEKEGGQTVKREPGTFLRDFLQELPPVIDYGETAGAEQQLETAAQDYSLPPGYSVNQEKMAIHNEAVAYMEAHEGVEYESAVQIVSKQRGN